MFDLTRCLMNSTVPNVSYIRTKIHWKVIHEPKYWINIQFKRYIAHPSTYTRNKIVHDDYVCRISDEICSENDFFFLVFGILCATYYHFVAFYIRTYYTMHIHTRIYGCNWRSSKHPAKPTVHKSWTLTTSWLISIFNW